MVRGLEPVSGEGQAEGSEEENPSRTPQIS